MFCIFKILSIFYGQILSKSTDKFIAWWAVCYFADEEQDVLTEDTEREETHTRNETGIACLI